MQQQGEPSVEEILDSIKKVIARDNREGMILERRRRSAPGSTEESASPSDERETDEVLELAEEIALDDASATSGDDGESADSDTDALTRGDTRDAMRQNFAALAGADASAMFE